MNGLDLKPLSLANLVVLGKLGRGSTSHVFRVQSTGNKKLYAMKVFDKKSSKFNQLSLKKELDLHKKLKHEHVVELISHIEDADNHYVLTEYCEGGELTKKVAERVEQSQIADIALQIACGLDYLHSQGIAHCDLKLSNLLVNKGKVKICDFGYSARIQESSPKQKEKLFGTVFYMAPQIVKSNKRMLYKEADVWAFGICLLIIITKRQPYSGSNFKQIRRQILEGIRLDMSLVSEQLSDMMKRLLQTNPSKRLTLSQLYNHSFLTRNKSKTIQKGLQKDRSLSAKDDIKFQLENQQQKQLTKKQQKWRFKRTVQQDNNQNTNNTIHKKTPLYISKDNDITVKNLKQHKTKSLTSSQYKNRQDNEQLLKGHKQQIIKKLTIVEARTISPFCQFHYETKNQGFIKINKNGQLQIKIKNIVYDILQKGNVLRLQNQCYKLQDINKNPTDKQYKIAYELYQYALHVVNILRSKKYRSQKLLSFNNQDFIISLHKQKYKFIGITKIGEKGLILEYNGDKKQMFYKLQGQKWINLNDSCDKNSINNLEICQLAKFLIANESLLSDE